MSLHNLCFCRISLFTGKNGEVFLEPPHNACEGQNEQDRRAIRCAVERLLSAMGKGDANSFERSELEKELEEMKGFSYSAHRNSRLRA